MLSTLFNDFPRSALYRIAIPRLLPAILLIAIGLFAGAGCKGQVSLPEIAPPNIVWITAEDMGPNLGAYGDTYAQSPHLDSLAARGVVYQNAFATAPVCAVARAALISGMHASSFGAQHMRTAAKLPRDVVLYPQLLRSAGYYVTNNVKTDYNIQTEPALLWDGLGNAVHWRDRPDSTQPFFAIFNLVTTHESRINDETLFARATAHLKPEQQTQPGAVPLPEYFPQTPVVEAMWARYYSLITAMDQQVGAILKQLHEDGLSDQTIVFFYSDHGAGVPRHKRWLFDGGLRVPLIVHVPERYQSLMPHAPGTRTDELVSFVDLPATLLRLAGVSIPAFYQGRPFLGQDLPPERTYVFAGRDRMDERYDIQRAVRNKRFKYIRYYEPRKPYTQYMNTPERGAIMQAIRAAGDAGMPSAGKHMLATEKPAEALYDVSSDPYELRNLVTDSRYTMTLDSLRLAHAAWVAETKDTGLIPETVLRHWEAVSGLSIYDYLRNHTLDIALLQNTAAGLQSVTDLLRLIGHENAAIRYWAAVWLGNTGNNPGVDLQALLYPVLQKAVTDDVPAVRIAASRVSLRMGQSDGALPVLRDALRHEDEWVRLLAAQVLDEAGPLARPVAEALREAMGDGNKYVVRVVNHALNQLEGTQREVP